MSGETVPLNGRVPVMSSVEGGRDEWRERLCSRDSMESSLIKHIHIFQKGNSRSEALIDIKEQKGNKEFRTS